jgi:hypothetical protein
MVPPNRIEAVAKDYPNTIEVITGGKPPVN